MYKLGKHVHVSDKCDASEGHLVIFDQRKRKSWKEKIFMRKERWNDSEIMVWGM
jgi:hypothetical protein